MSRLKEGDRTFVSSEKAIVIVRDECDRLSWWGWAD